MQAAKAESAALGWDPTREGLAERELIEAARRGDQGAFAELVRLHDRGVLSLALRLLRSPEDAQDAYQESFLKVYCKLDTFRFQCQFRTWIYRIVKNVCLDHLRRRKARPEFTASVPEANGRPSPLDLAADARPDGSPDRVAGSGEISSRIRRALDTLSDRERLVFTMRHYEGLRLRAIADVCSMSEEAAKHSLFRATRKLRRELRDVR